MHISITKLIISRWAEELAALTGKDAGTIVKRGLSDHDFPKQTVQVECADESRITFRDALLLRRPEQGEMAVISRHGASVELRDLGTRVNILPQQSGSVL